MLFLVVILAALTAAQNYTTIDLISALSGQSQLTNFTSYLGLFPTLVTQINAGNFTGTVTFVRMRRNNYALTKSR